MQSNLEETEKRFKALKGTVQQKGPALPFVAPGDTSAQVCYLPSIVNTRFQTHRFGYDWPNVQRQIAWLPAVNTRPAQAEALPLRGHRLLRYQTHLHLYLGL